MIRINLLPDAKRLSAAAAGEEYNAYWFGGYFAAALLCIAACVAVYFNKSAEIDEMRQQNQSLQARIADLNAKAANINDVRARLEASQELERVVEQLNRSRTGPTRLLVELSRVLTAGVGPTTDPEEMERLRSEDPDSLPSTEWDVRHLSITSFIESSGPARGGSGGEAAGGETAEVMRPVIIKGVAQSPDDVGEFIIRLDASVLFREVQLANTERNDDDSTDFELRAEVIY